MLYFYVFNMTGILFVVLHLFFLHKRGSSNTFGVDTNYDKIKFFPYFLLKDFFSLVIVIFLIRFFIRVYPLELGDPENFNLASIYTTPTHIKPE